MRRRLESHSSTQPRLRCRFAALAATVAGLLVPSPANADFVPRAGEEFFGVNGQALTQDALSLDTTLLDRQAASISGNLGAGWARVPLAWNGTEPLPPVAGLHTYLFAASDKVVAALARQGVKASLQLGGTPAWATSASNLLTCVADPRRAAPTNLDAFADFAAAAAKRYGPGGRFWADHPELPYVPANLEVYNEPNWNGFWCPGPNPSAYADLLARAIARVEAVAPQTEVIMGGLVVVKDGDTRSRGMQTRRFVEEMLAAKPSLAAQLDAVGLHLYGGGAENNYELLSWFRSILAENGLADVPIYLNEFGWPTNGPGDLPLTEADRAAELGDMAHRLWRTDCNLAGIAVHTWHTPQANPLDPEDWFGIADRLTGELYETGRAYRDEIALATGRGEQPAPRSTVRVCGGEEPDTDGDGVADPQDDFPLDETRTDGSDETNPEDEVETATPLHPARLPADFFGVERGTLAGPMATQGLQLDAMRDAGLGRLRITVSWRALEPAPPGSPDYSLDWGYLDSQVYAAARRGLQPQLQVLTKPTWAPLDSAGIATHYARFMGLVAERYGRGGDFWRSYPAVEPLPLLDYEVWYSANWSSEWWDGSASPAEYGDAVSKVRAAIKAADPAARAIASLAPDGTHATAWEFLRQMGTPADGAFLAVYGTPADARASMTQIDNSVPPLRSALDQTTGAGAPISIQIGYQTGGSGQISQAERAVAYRSVLERTGRSNCGVSSVSFRSWNDAVTGYGIADSSTRELNASGQAISETAKLYTGWATQEAPRDPVLLCGSGAPDRDGDGVPDSQDDFPLDEERGSADPAPDTTISSGPPPFSRSASASFAFSSNASGARFVCRLDGGAPEGCKAAHTVSGLSDGDHVLEVEAVSPGGRHDPTPARAQFEVDTKAPATSISVLRKSRRGARVLRISADEPGAAFECSLDAGPTAPCEGRYRIPSLKNGRHELLAVAADRAGNEDPTPARLLFRVRR